jgi:hypothetical protein
MLSRLEKSELLLLSDGRSFEAVMTHRSLRFDQ